MSNIDKNKGYSLISRKPLKESEMSENRQYHRRMVRQAESKAYSTIQNPSGKKKKMIGKMLEDRKTKFVTRGGQKATYVDKNKILPKYHKYLID